VTSDFEIFFERTPTMPVKTIAVASIWLIPWILCMSPAPAAAGQENTNPAAPEAPREGSGLWGRLDPVTGELVAPTGPAGEGLIYHAPWSSSGEGLQPYPLPGGGVGLSLEKRFRSSVYAVEGEGGVVVSHRPPEDAPVTGEEAEEAAP
jgi:hypothetical protein